MTKPTSSLHFVTAGSLPWHRLNTELGVGGVGAQLRNATWVHDFEVFEFYIEGWTDDINKLSLVGMQLPKKYKEKFDVSTEGPSSGVTSRLGSGYSVTPEERPSLET
jgi:hypothetical protein